LPLWQKKVLNVNSPLSSAPILNTTMPGPEKPMSHKLTPFSASKTDLARQYWLPELHWATGCDEGKYLINFILKSKTKKEKSHGKTNHQL
jgi:hypothetical protein